MHNNGLVKFIAFFFTFVCVIQLSNTFFTNKIESDADLFSELAVNEDQDDFVIKRQVSKKSYLDSISNLENFFSISSGRKHHSLELEISQKNHPSEG